jgi:hypothetical protein
MDIQVKLLSVLPEVKGTSAKGEWKKQDANFLFGRSLRSGFPLLSFCS